MRVRGVVAVVAVLAAGAATSCARRDQPLARPTTAMPTPPSPRESSPSPTRSPTAVARPSPSRTSASPRPTRRATARPTSAPSRTAGPPSPAPARTLAPFHGLGTWVDGYDFAREFGGTLSPSALGDMAAQGVRTLYLQAAKEHEKSPGVLLSTDLLGAWLEGAHARGIKVVGWYLPTFVDPDRDWAHLEAMLAFRSGAHAFDAVGVDIESRELADVSVRNERLVALSRRLRNAAPGMALQGIVLPPVVTDVIAPDYWPEFPWQRIADLYDVWSPMAYWTNRTPESGWRHAYTYAAENIRMTRRNLDRSSAVVHVVGGIGDKTTTDDLDGFVRAAHDLRTIGGSLYDYATTGGSAWATLRRVPD